MTVGLRASIAKCMLTCAAVLGVAALANHSPAWAAGGSVPGHTARDGRAAQFFNSPRLTRLKGTYFASFRATQVADEIEITNNVGLVVPFSTRKLKCPSPGACFVRMTVDTFTNGQAGNLYLSPYMSGAPTDVKLVGITGGLEWQRQVTFFFKIPSGRRAVSLYMLSYSDVTLRSYDISYEVFKP